MTIAEVKAELGVEQLNLVEDKDQTSKEPTGWYRQWLNESRTAIVVHKDVVDKIVAGENPNLGIKDPVTKTGAKGDYILKTIVAYTSADVTL